MDPNGYAQDFDSYTAVAVLRMAFYGALRPEIASSLAPPKENEARGGAHATTHAVALVKSRRFCHPSVV